MPLLSSNIDDDRNLSRLDAKPVPGGAAPLPQRSRESGTTMDTNAATTGQTSVFRSVPGEVSHLENR